MRHEGIFSGAGGILGGLGAEPPLGPPDITGASHPYGYGSGRGYRPYSMMRTGLRPGATVIPDNDPHGSLAGTMAYGPGSAELIFYLALLALPGFALARRGNAGVLKTILYSVGSSATLGLAIFATQFTARDGSTAKKMTYGAGALGGLLLLTGKKPRRNPKRRNGSWRNTHYYRKRKRGAIKTGYSVCVREASGKVRRLSRHHTMKAANRKAQQVYDQTGRMAFVR